MEFTSLGVAKMWPEGFGSAARAASNATPTPAVQSNGPILEEIGVSGTPIFSGFLSDQGEFKPELFGLPWMRVAERMRRGDATVAATLCAVGLPIADAEWIVAEPKNPTPIEKEITAFLNRQFFEQQVNFRKVLKNALLMLPFGCAAHEDCYEIVNGEVNLSEALPRLPLTFYQFDTNDYGHLVNLVQLGYQGPEYEYVPVPASKLAYFAFQKEGDNWYGRSLLRPAYHAWYAKVALENIDDIAHERNGMGFPNFKLPPNAQKEDIAKINKWVQSIAVHQAASLVRMDGSEFELTGVTGTVKDALPKIQYWGTQITMIALAQFLMIGQQSHGARSLGETQTDFFALGMGSVAQDIADTLNATTARRLIEFNYGPLSARRFRQPMLKAAKILSLNIETITKAIAALGDVKVGLIQADDELEAYLRSELGLPAMNGKPRVKPGVTVPAAPGAPSATPAPPQIAASNVIDGVNLSRAPRGAETSLAFSAIVGRLDRGRNESAALLRTARKSLQAEALHKLASAKPGKLHRASIPTDPALVASLTEVLGGIADFGTEQVAQERARQTRGASPKGAEAIRGKVAASSTYDSSKNPAGLYAETEVSDFLTQLQSRAARVVSGLRRDGLREGELLTKAGQLLDDQPDGWIDGLASEGANSAFASGRQAGYEQNKDAIGSVQYSALLDPNTCDACESADGEDGETPDDITAVPNPDCGGGDKCRCVHVYVFADEEKAA